MSQRDESSVSSNAVVLEWLDLERELDFSLTLYLGSNYPMVRLTPEVHIGMGGPLDGPVLPADDIIAAVADVAPCANYLTAICTAVSEVIGTRECVPMEAGIAALAGILPQLTAAPHSFTPPPPSTTAKPRTPTPTPKKLSSTTPQRTPQAHIAPRHAASSGCRGASS
ncbi:hypothetical protein WJX73_002425 [Symbiochloris irregularis]|uniref:Uncharacterized protein n=1 Tax=Symbiochloris irregularis TaxID=706552 RepID=A0AAW1NIX2_9CHLO